jgi:hypothetical protein
MKFDELHDMWSKDCEISKDLHKESIETPLLHAKYLRILNQEKGKLVFLEMEQKKLLKKKWLYYNGKMSQEDIEKEGWDFDPFEGLKVLKGEMNYYYDADTDIQHSEAKILLKKQVIDTLKEILENIKWRHQTIRNAIEWKKFENGV